MLTVNLCSNPGVIEHSVAYFIADSVSKLTKCIAKPIVDLLEMNDVLVAPHQGRFIIKPMHLSQVFIADGY
jgi:hypothetical protein